MNTLINKQHIKSHLRGISKEHYFLEKIDMHTYRLVTYKPLRIHDLLGYYFKVTFDYSAPAYGRFATYLIQNI